MPDLAERQLAQLLAMPAVSGASVIGAGVVLAHSMAAVRIGAADAAVLWGPG